MIGQWIWQMLLWSFLPKSVVSTIFSRSIMPTSVPTGSTAGRRFASGPGIFESLWSTLDVETIPLSFFRNIPDANRDMVSRPGTDAFGLTDIHHSSLD